MTTNNDAAQEARDLPFAVIDELKEDIINDWIVFQREMKTYEVDEAVQSIHDLTEFSLQYASAGIDSMLKHHKAHLWSRADDPEVVEAVALASYRVGRIPPMPIGVTDDMIRHHPRWIHGKRVYMEEARAALTAGLEALLGPRPTEQEET